ncbi:MAG: hypothetical protein IJA34_09960 [Lachnospiraceae bacterium]|nr:hypothetical protein [Lachnospiraceae bacterium]
MSGSGRLKRNVVPIILVIFLLISIGIIIILLTKDDDSKNNESTTIIETDKSGGRGTVVTEDNVSEILESQKDSGTTADGYYTTSMSIDWHFDGLVSKDAYVANDTKNTRTVYFDLLLKDTNEMIYSSPYIPVGAELKGVTLDKKLDKGTYETILVYHLVDEDEKEVSTLSISLTIFVK